MKYGKIYIVENIHNDKVYIGQTTRSIKNRMKAHMEDYRKLQKKFEEEDKDYNEERFCVKYASDPSQFVVSILEESVPINQLTIRENYWINNYDSIERGYNISNISHQNLLIKKDPEKINNYHFKDDELPKCEKCMEYNDFITGEYPDNWYCNNCYLVSKRD